MCLWVALWCALAAGGAAATKGCCRDVEGVDYIEETLLNETQFPDVLAVDFATNLLYFRYFKHNDWSSATLDLLTGAVAKIEELVGRCCFAVDQRLQQVHAGCMGSKGRMTGGGLFQFDSNVGRFELAGERDHPVAFVHYNDFLYYSLPGDFSRLRKFVRGTSHLVPDTGESLVKSLVVDNQNDWIFYNYSGMYRQRRGAKAGVKVDGAGLQRPCALAVDVRGVAYASSSSAIYRLAGTPRAPNVTKLLDLRECAMLTFDRDNNLIFSYDDRIVRLLNFTLPAPVLRPATSGWLHGL